MADATDSTPHLEVGPLPAVRDEPDHPYPFQRLELTPTGAAELIKEILSSNDIPLKRGAICDRVQRLHVARGGKQTNNLVMKVKKALAGLRELGEVRQPIPGYYTSGNSGQQPPLETSDEETTGTEEGFGEEESEEDGLLTIKPESEIGDGSEQVYVYYYKSERELAELKGQPTWPCKVGRTTASVEERLLGQGAITAMHTLPVLALVIKTSHGRLVENVIHCALRLAGCSISGPGAEWFKTNPDMIRRWYEAFVTDLNMLLT